MLGTQIIATLIAVYGLFMTPLGWKWAGFVWAYALIFFLINDRIKLITYKILDRKKAKTLVTLLRKPEGKDISDSKNPLIIEPDTISVTKIEDKKKDETKPAKQSDAKVTETNDSDVISEPETNNPR